MPDEIRWVVIPDSYLAPRLRMPMPTRIVCVPVVDILAQLERPDELRDTLALLLARQSEHYVNDPEE